MEQTPVPLHDPPQPVNIDPLDGVGVKFIDVPATKAAVQLVPQLIPTGKLVIVPAPVPKSETVSRFLVLCPVLKVAVTFASALRVIEQLPVPLHDPPQPANVDPLVGVGVNIIDVPAAKVAVQVVPQLIPAGELVIVPIPVPESEVVRL